MTRADFGLLGSYNKYLKSPFETFYVGGDGMSGSYTHATETIALRGYDNGALTPYGKDGYAYTRFGVELHFPFMLPAHHHNLRTGVCRRRQCLDFGERFCAVRSSNAAPVPVCASICLWWVCSVWTGPHGFDRDYLGKRGGSHFHFVLGQEF